MEANNRRSRRKIAIVVLAILLGLSVVALAGTLLYDRFVTDTPVTVSVPDNLITPEGETASTTAVSTEATAVSAETTVPSAGANGTTGAQAAAGAGTSATVKAPEATTIALYDRQPEENRPFSVGNMFPGDAETKYFRVQVSYHDRVTVHYHAAVRPGYEKLAEVLRVRIVLLTSGEELYDGLMRDMPESLSHTLTAAASTTDELYYQITAYLDTGVGNEYQNRDLLADFRWWVEETGNLEPVPTGDIPRSLPWVLAAVFSGSACLILLLVRKRRKEETEDA